MSTKTRTSTRIGISGWRYTPWRDGRFYPRKWPQRAELDYASRQFNSIEINGSFYSLQRPSSYQEWYDHTPDGFVFSMKGGRFITHMRRLRDIEEPLASYFASGLLKLKEKLGPILWQFPPNFVFDEERFDAFFSMLPRDTEAAAKLAKKHRPQMKGDRVWTQTDAKRPLRYAAEVRHKSFLDERWIKLLRKHNIANVVADTASKWPYIEDVTADFVYVRLHGDEELYVSGYTDAALDHWAKRVDAWREGREPEKNRNVSKAGARKRASRDVFVYFDNDAKVKAPGDALGLMKRLGVEWSRPDIPDEFKPGGKRPATSRGRARKTRRRRA